MLSTVKKDKNRRILVKKFEIKKLYAKVFQQDRSLQSHLEERYKTLSLLSGTLPKKLKKSLRFFSFVRDKGGIYPFLYEKATETIPRNSSKTRVTSRCIKSGRSRAVLKFCKLSRIALREEASKGSIPGVCKASW